MPLISKITDYIYNKKLITRAINYTRNKIPFAHTQNHKYDLQTRAIIKKECSPGGNCVDVGCYRGDIMDFCLKYAPGGKHFGFEPIPGAYEYLTKKYVRGECALFNLALSDKAGMVEFHHVVSDPGYSGFRERKYRTENEIINKIKVKVDKLDNIIPPELNIDFIKIDVEGGEFLVLKGARELIERCKPIVVFEFDPEAADYYGTTSDDVYDFFKSMDMKISLMENFLSGKTNFTAGEFRDQFRNRRNFYFLAYS